MPIEHSGVDPVVTARKAVDAEPGAQKILTDSDDVILTAEEIRSLDVSGTNLVILSACETRLAALTYGQGVMGLQSAFHAGGPALSSPACGR
jgi:CHAT domain-containing protein